MAHELGLTVTVAFLSGCSIITHARNQLVADFLESPADKLVFVDADVAWAPGSMLRLVSHPVPFVAGAYRLKKDPEEYPVHFDGEQIFQDDETGLLIAKMAPAGFLALDRTVFDALRTAHPDRTYLHGGRAFHGYFHAPIANGHFLGEDGAFCADWRDAGGRVLIDPDLILTHIGGPRAFTGEIGSWIKRGGA